MVDGASPRDRALHGARDTWGRFPRRDAMKRSAQTKPPRRRTTTIAKPASESHAIAHVSSVKKNARSQMSVERLTKAGTILVRTGHGVAEEAAAAPLADHVADDLAAAVAIIATLAGPEA